MIDLAYWYVEHFWAILGIGSAVVFVSVDIPMLIWLVRRIRRKELNDNAET